MRLQLATTAVITLLVLSLSACTASIPPAADTGSSTPETAAPLKNDAEQTLWSVQGSGVPLADDDPDVSAIRKLVVLHSGAVDNRSPENIASTIDQEFGYYTPKFLGELEQADYAQRLTELYTSNDLSTIQQAVAWYPSVLAKDHTTATANFESTIRFTNANAKYLTERKFNQGQDYTQGRKLTLVKANGTWRIDDIEKGELNVVSSSDAGNK